ncbi:uncharacterized protein EAE98_003882 [Botrytis deweyae]|uniref:Uncharacterized protein n=1 Tax=Botrytis deweyae TaxID=2478750 RepID=A0ABQ7IS09_9HELO|nr:uncharacterized protein EAE98_003882 [Botrytis deweyae]KAF7932583.1 hypothetical protein EAE98_003882 [Botrytis deweyae]
MCCCFGSRGEHVEPVKKIPQHEFDEKKKAYESNGHRSSLPRRRHSNKYVERDSSRDSSNSPRNGSRGSQNGYGSSSGSGSSRDLRGYNSNVDSHRYSNGGYGQEGYIQGGHSQGVRSPPSLGTSVLRGSASRY